MRVAGSLCRYAAALAGAGAACGTKPPLASSTREQKKDPRPPETTAPRHPSLPPSSPPPATSARVQARPVMRVGRPAPAVDARLGPHVLRAASLDGESLFVLFLRRVSPACGQHKSDVCCAGHAWRREGVGTRATPSPSSFVPGARTHNDTATLPLLSRLSTLNPTHTPLPPLLPSSQPPPIPPTTPPPPSCRRRTVV